MHWKIVSSYGPKECSLIKSAHRPARHVQGHPLSIEPMGLALSGHPRIGASSLSPSYNLAIERLKVESNSDSHLRRLSPLLTNPDQPGIFVS
eukprot:306126-Prorocentrum_minimum.AAC.2